MLRGSGYNPKRRRDSERLAVEASVQEIRYIADLLADVVPSSSQHAWMEWPTVSVAFVHRADVLAELGLLGRGEWVRGGAQGDQRLARRGLVAAWLAARGVDLT